MYLLFGGGRCVFTIRRGKVCIYYLEGEGVCTYRDLGDDSVVPATKGDGAEVGVGDIPHVGQHSQIHTIGPCYTHCYVDLGREGVLLESRQVSASIFTNYPPPHGEYNVYILHSQVSLFYTSSCEYHKLLMLRFPEPR